METIKKDILTYLDNQIGELRDNDMLGDYMDSLDAVEMVMWIEKKYDIVIDDEAWYNWNSGTINDVVSYVYRRLHDEHLEQCTPKKKDVKHIYIPDGVSKVLKGKTIEKTYYHRDFYDSSMNALIIQFTDGEYINIAIDIDDDYFLNDNKFVPLDEDHISTYGRIDKNNNFVYYEHYRNLFEMGVIEPIPNDFVRDEILRREQEEEKREYNRYLQLKARFENYNPLEQ